MAGPLNDIANDIVNAFFTDTPTMPAAPHVDLGDQQALAIQSNTKNLSADEQLASSVNSFNFDQIQSMLRKAIPGYDQIVNKQKDIIGSELNGELPQDVQDAIQRNAATRSVAGGYSGTGMARNLNARDLGLTSLNLTNQGLDSASRWLSQMKSTAMPSMFNLASMFISPEQQAQNEWQNQISSFQRNWSNSVMLTNASNAKTHAIANLGADTVNLALSAYTGGASSMMTSGGGGGFGAGAGNAAAGAEGEPTDTYGGGGGGGMNYSAMLKSFMGN